ncbi:MAG: hypothetical protein H6706_02060 [Myxococcales bacterium]|nr:hypothetical protein [Myxococcales bacterium]
MRSLTQALGAILIASLALVACGEEADAPPRGEGVGAVGGPGGAGSATALELRPRLRLVGLGEISDALDVERLSFEAEIFVLPEDLDQAGDAVPVRYVFDEEGDRTELPERALRLSGPGAYQVLVRIRPDADGVSVAVGGALQAPEDDELIERGKADDLPLEPAPSPSEPAPSPSEPAPSPSEPAPSPSEPAPSPSEPAPSPSDEPALPLPGAGGADLPFAEPAPSPSEGGPDDARGKADAVGFDPGETEVEGDALFVRSRRSFEFYAGIVEVTPGDRELLVTWDVSEWLRSVLSEPLGLTGTLVPVPERRTERPGFDDVPADFRIDAR